MDRDRDKIENEKRLDARTTEQPASGIGGLLNGMSFPPNGVGWAIKQMYHGLKVRRRGWNGQGMWLALQIPDTYSKMTLPYIYMSTAQHNLVPWLCSQTDLLAMDWEVATL